MKRQILFLSAFLAFWSMSTDIVGQCTSADIMEPGFNFITSSRGCAPFTIEVQTLYLNTSPGTTYQVDWGDGNSDNYTHQVGNVNGPIISHEYVDAPVDCGYQVTIEVENACNPLGSVVLEPINVIVWTEDIITADPDIYRVCEGFASSINFTDASNWNCFPRLDLRENSDPRWIQWIYGDTINANRIPGIRVDGIVPGGFPYYDPSVGLDPFYPVIDTGRVSLNVQIPATASIGNDFYVTLNNWNTCNPYDADLTDGNPLNPATAGGDNPARTTKSRIVIVASPTPDFVTRKENGGNPITWDFCIDDIIYFDDESTGPGGSALARTWEFYDGPTIADGLLATNTDVNPTYTFSKGGMKLVRLIVGDNNAVGGCNAIVEKLVNVTPTSIAQISATNTNFCKTPGSTETFSVTFSDVTIGSTVNTEWKWEFYNENNNLVRNEPATGFSSGAAATYSQSYSNTGIYKVVLITRDIVTICDTRDEVNIVIYNNPEPSFVFADICESLPIELIETSTLQDINGNKMVRWEWDFDYDNITFTADTTFDNTRPDTLTRAFNFGVRQVALRVTNDQNGCNAMAASTVEIFQNPIASFTKDSLEGCSPLVVSFENTAIGSQPVAIDQYVWRIDYGTGFIDTLKANPSVLGFSPITIATFENWSISAKTFNIKLKSISQDGCAFESELDSVKVLPSIKPGFFYTNYEPLGKNCAPVEVNFQVDDFTANLLPIDYTWTISYQDSVIRQDKNAGSNSQLTHTFEAIGKGINNYSINLIADINDICVGDSTIKVNVNPVPESNFTIDTIEFNCDVMILEIDAKDKGLLEYRWTINKGGMVFINTSYGDRFTYEVPRPGPTSLNLDLDIDLQTVNYAFCESAITSQSLVVPSQPQLSASFAVNPEMQVFPNATVTINNTSTQTNATHFWDFGNGNTNTDENPISQVYDKPGNYTITLNLDQEYCQSADSVNIFIQPTAPIADFSYGPAKGCAPLTVNFSNLTKYGDPDGYIWYFGQNEGISRKENPVHIYRDPGVYSVKLEATNESGITDTEAKRMIIEVYPNPHAEFQIRPEIVKLPDDPIYTSNLSFDADSYYWDFGDGAKSSEYEPSHTYLDTGKYDIALVAITNNGCTDTVIYENIIEVIDGNEIQIPNAFTPNLDGPTGGSRYADGRNDVFFPVTEGVIAYKMQIYNRWGELLFDTEDSNRGWDGYYRGKLCSPDVYIYKMDFKFIDGREVMKFGDITLIR